MLKFSLLLLVRFFGTSIAEEINNEKGAIHSTKSSIELAGVENGAIKSHFASCSSDSLVSLSSNSDIDGAIIFIDAICVEKPCKVTVVLKQINRFFILGASAIILFALNQAAVFKDEAFFSFSDKVKLFHVSNISGILAVIKSVNAGLLKQYPQFRNEKSDSKSTNYHSFSILPWRTCAKMNIFDFSPYGGTVCPQQNNFLGASHKNYSIDSVNNPRFVISSIICSICLCLMIFNIKKCWKLHNKDRLAWKILKALPTTKNRTELELDLKSFCDDCSICLQEMAITDLGALRQLPCRHLFHRDCVDQWLLIEQFTCPLCKFDIFDWFCKKNKMLV